MRPEVGLPEEPDCCILGSIIIIIMGFMPEDDDCCGGPARDGIWGGMREREGIGIGKCEERGGMRDCMRDDIGGIRIRDCMEDMREECIEGGMRERDEDRGPYSRKYLGDFLECDFFLEL